MGEAAVDTEALREQARALILTGSFSESIGMLADAEFAYRQALHVIAEAGVVPSPEAEQAASLLVRQYVRTERRSEVAAVTCQALAAGPLQLWQRLAPLTQVAREKALLLHRRDVDRLLGNLRAILGDAAAARSALEVLLWRRGFGVEMHRAALRAGRRNPDVRQMLEALHGARATLAAAVFGAPVSPRAPHRTSFAHEGVRRSNHVDELEAQVFASVTGEDSPHLVKPPDCAAVAARLAADEALVEYWQCSFTGAAGESIDRYLAFVLRSGDPCEVTLWDLCAARDVEGGLVQRYLGALLQRAPDDTLPPSVGRDLAEPAAPDGVSSGDWRETGRQLRALVLDPLIPALAGARHLFLVPDGVLNRISFAALPTASGFVLDDFIVSYLASGRALREDSADGPAPGAAIVVGAPDYDRGETAGAGHSWFRELGGMRREAAETATRLGTAPILATAATERRLKDCHSPLILHLATHGVLLPVTPLVAEFSLLDATNTSSRVRIAAGLGRMSGIEIEDQALRSLLALAGVNTWLASGSLPEECEDGWLNAEDVALLDLAGTELVVLSACDTGLGVVEPGEGVLGLRSAFSAAGARTVISSLWRLDDDNVTPALVRAMYEHLCGRGRGRAKSLCLAQREFRARHPDRPDWWGPLVCHGDAGPLPEALLAQAGIPAGDVSRA